MRGTLSGVHAACVRRMLCSQHGVKSAFTLRLRLGIQTRPALPEPKALPTILIAGHCYHLNMSISPQKASILRHCGCKIALQQVQ